LFLRAKHYSTCTKIVSAVLLRPNHVCLDGLQQQFSSNIMLHLNLNEMPKAIFVTAVQSNNCTHFFMWIQMLKFSKGTTGDQRVPFVLAATSYGRTDNKSNEDITVELTV